MSTPDHPDYPYSGYPPTGQRPPSYPANAHPGYPPLPPPGFATYPPPGHRPYPPSVYGRQPNYVAQPAIRGVRAPGVIPLRPLSLSDIFNGAAVYIRANPRAALGLTAIVVVITQLISLGASVGPLAAASRLTSAPPDELSGGDVGAWVASAGLSGLIGWIGCLILTGMLTIVVGRAVFGGTISAGEAWYRIRGRLPALFSLVLFEAAGLILLAGGVGVIIGITAAAGNVPAAVLLGIPLVIMALAAVTYLYVALTFAPVLIMVERLPVAAAITRSFGLVRNSFWRVLGIRTLTWLVVTLIAGAIAVPFDFAGQLVGGSGPVLLAATVAAVGATIGRIVTAPFDAGVVVLLYTDRRIRSEAFDLVLQTGAANGPAAAPSTDFLWLTRPV